MADATPPGRLPLTPEWLGALALRLRNGPRLTPQQAAMLILQAAVDLEPLHDRHEAYGKLDPAKVRLTDDDPMATISPEEAGRWCSTCTAPECLLDPGRPLDPAGDIYTLGAILYELLTGNPPSAPPRRFDPSIPPALEAICLKAVAGNPDGRYSDARRLADALRRFLGPVAKTFSETLEEIRAAVPSLRTLSSPRRDAFWKRP